MAGFWRHNMWLKIISVIISIIVWMIVIGSKKIEVTKDIPIQILKAPDVVVANEIPEKVLLKLSGPKAFLRGILDRPEPPLRVNLTGVRPPALVTHRLQADSIRLPLGVEVQAVQPSAILIKLEEAAEKSVKVRLEMAGVPPEGFYVAKAAVSPSQVVLQGAEARLDALQEVATRPIEISHLRGVYEGPVDLDLHATGGLLVGEKPRAYIDIRALTPNFRIRNISVKIRSDRGGANTKAGVRVLDPTVNLLVRLESPDIVVPPEAVGVEIDPSGLPKGVHRLTPRVRLPEGAVLVRTVPEEIRVQIP